MYLVGLVLITAAFVKRYRQRSTKYGLIASGWAVVILHYLILEQDWPFACATAGLGVSYITLIVYTDWKGMVRTKIKK